MALNWRAAPFVGLCAYYVVVVGLAAVLVQRVPAVRQAFVAPIVLPALGGEAALLTGSPAAAPVAGTTLAPTLERALTTALVTLGTLALVLPVAWIYRSTRGAKADRSLIHSLIILPLVVAGIVIVVKNSLALAFSLAGIVAAVRFRNTLKDPRDAVYIFLALGLGLSAGVQALDVALVVSLTFNLVVLVLWRLDVGGIDPASGGTVAASLAGAGILRVRTRDPDATLQDLPAALDPAAKEWHVVDTRPGTDGTATLEVVVRLKKKQDPSRLLAELEERWAERGVAAEYVPVQRREESG